MSSIGPDLPPHLLAKRKRQQEEAEAEKSSKADADGAEKRQRVLGPAPPPAPLDERPPHDSDDDSSSDDEYGPAVPKGDAANMNAYDSDSEDKIPTAPKVTKEQADQPIKRDDWMMQPPTADGLSRHMDPAKRPRQFRSGPGALKSGSGSGSGNGMDASWTETPEEKRKRLRDQVLGISNPSKSGDSKEGKDTLSQKKDEEAARRIMEYNAKHRGKSLLEMHKSSHGPAADEDDPSKRAFDREKDIGGNVLGKSQEKELLKRSAGFGSKFSGGKYL